MSNSKLSAVVLATLAVATGAGCSTHSVMVKRPENAAVDTAITTRWTTEIRHVAQDGDWILTRSYYLVADGIASVSGGTPLSHASLYSAERGTVIEAVGDGVREIPLEQLLQRNHYAIVVHPSAMSTAQRSAAVTRARSKIGVPFDVAGMFGLGSDDSFYCSELVFWSSGLSGSVTSPGRVVTPTELMDYGPVVYWSGERSDEQMQAIASTGVNLASR